MEASLLSAPPADPGTSAPPASPPGGSPPPAAPPPATPPASWVNPDGTFAAGWMDRLPENLRGNPSLQSVPSITDLANSYVHTKGMVGKKFQAPSESSTPEEIAAWRKTVGAPETPEGYGELRPEDFPEEQWDKATAAELTKIAHKHHLPPAAVKDIIALHAGSVKASMEKFSGEEKAFREQELATLRKEWGADFDQQAHAAKTFAAALGLDPDKTMEFASSGFVLAMARGAKLLMGDKLVTGAPATLSSSLESRIGEIQRSPEYLGERGTEAQARAQQQLHSLYEAQSKQRAA